MLIKGHIQLPSKLPNKKHIAHLHTKRRWTTSIERSERTLILRIEDYVDILPITGNGSNKAQYRGVFIWLLDHNTL